MLRAIERADVEQLAAMEAEPETWRLADEGPWLPSTVADALKRYDDGTAYRADRFTAPFVVEVRGTVVGRVVLWGIDLHNRRAHLGITLAPQARGRGYGTDAVRVLLRYAFVDRGLHRVELTVLADNAQALAAYRRAGFVEEGRQRQAAWVDGRFVDLAVMAALAPEWPAASDSPE